MMAMDSNHGGYEPIKSKESEMKNKYGAGLATLSPIFTTNSFEQGSGKAISPQDVLPDGKDSIRLQDGTVARKGTVKATLDNIDLLNKILSTEAFSKVRQKKIDSILQAITEMMPALNSLGIFQVFRISEWLQGNQNLGRILVGLTYLETYFHQESIQEQAVILLRLQEILATFSDHEIQSRIKKVMKLKEVNSS
jgi:hypothetical protein